MSLLQEPPVEVNRTYVCHPINDPAPLILRVRRVRLCGSRWLVTGQTPSGPRTLAYDDLGAVRPLVSG